MTSHLAILLLGEHVADVERTRAGSLRLTYTRSALHDGGTPPLPLPPPGEGILRGGTGRHLPMGSPAREP